MPARTKRIRLSFLARRTQELLFWVLGICAISLASVYLFLMNHLSMEGYILTVETEQSKEVGAEMDKIETQVAKYETRKYVAGMTETKNMVIRKQQNFLVLKPKFTAQR